MPQEIETIVLSLGGSLIVPNGGIDTSFLKGFSNFIRRQIRERNRRFFIVTGGGGTCREYQKGAKDVMGEITDEDMDWLGIHVTRLNGHLLRTIFRDLAYPKVLDQYQTKEDTKDCMVVIAGGWKPGWSTDYDMVLVARDYGAKLGINVSNIDMVYDKDPKKFAEAKPIKTLSWKDYRVMTGDKWMPGMNIPFDPIASRLASEIGFKVVILNGKNLPNLEKALDSQEFVGTVIS